MDSSIIPVALAAGKGTRMNSEIPKVLHPCFGEPMIQHVQRSLRRTSMGDPVVVLGEGRAEVEEVLTGAYRTVIQENQRGTGHAVQQVLESESFAEDKSLLVTCGDIPGIRPETLENFAGAYADTDADFMVLTTERDDPEGYGRVLLDEDGNVDRIVEEADASQDEKTIRRINTGIVCGRIGTLAETLPDLRTDNAQSEVYLTDVVHELRSNQKVVEQYKIDDTWQVTGINTRRELVDFEREGYRRRVDELLDSGVTVHDPDRVKIGPWVEVARDVSLEGSVTVVGESVLEKGVTLRGDSFVGNSSIDSHSRIASSYVRSSNIGRDVRVGPFAHIRPGCDVKDNVKVGNFVEMKKTTVGQDSNVSHLSYIGDAELGEGVNVGAGTITCNYDGSEKHKTTVEDGAFIGSNVEIVAPVTVGAGATIGAGSTITEDVPAGGLGIGRDRQKNLDNWN